MYVVPLRKVVLANDFPSPRARRSRYRLAPIVTIVKHSELPLEVARGLLANLPHAAFWKDRDSLYLGCNEHFARIVCEGEPDEIVGKTDYDLHCSPEEAELYVAQDRRVMETGEEVVNEETSFRRRDGSLVVVLISKVALRNDQGGITGVLGTFVDITELRMAEAERAALQDRVRRSERLESLGLLAGSVAHDFNNLLVGIHAATEAAILDLAQDHPAARRLRQVLATAEQAAGLTRQMLASAGRGGVPFQPISLRRLVDETCDAIRDGLEPGSEIRIETLGPIPEIRGDSTQLRQLVMNLVTNASDALKGEVGEVVVRVGSQELNEANVAELSHGDPAPGPHAYVEVEDDGCGMSAEVQDSIFQPFFTTKTQGRGLGLAAVLGILRRHQGGVIVRSREGFGTRIRVLLPGVVSPAVTGGDQPDEANSSRVLRAASRPKSSATVLIGDDDENVRWVVEEILSDAGYRVIAAKGALSIESELRAQPRQVDALILDMSLPGLGSVEVVTRLREVAGDIPVVLISGHDLDVIGEPLSFLHIVERLQKPFGRRLLIDAVEQALGARS